MVQPSPGPWWHTVARWRNWPVLVKLAAVLVVPVVVAVTLGFLQVRSEIGQADQYLTIQRVIALRDSLTPLTAQLQRERTLAAQVPTQGVAAFHAQAKNVDDAAAKVADAAHRTVGLSAASSAWFNDLQLNLGQLPAIRRPVEQSSDADTDAVSAYTQVIETALNFDQALVVQLGDPSLSSPATALLDLEGAQEQIRLEQAVVLVGIARGHLIDAEAKMLAASATRYDDNVANFQAVASPEWQQAFQQTVSGVDVGTRRQLLDFASTQPVGQAAPAQNAAKKTGGVHNAPATGGLTIPLDEWNRTSDATVTLVNKVATGLAGQVRDTATALQEGSSDRAGLESVVLVVTVLLAGGVGLVVGRYLLGSLGVLRRTALDVASRRLPEAVAKIREGRGEDVRIDPVPVYTTEEFGQVARAFDEVHGQAVKSAAEQASLRSNLGNIFVNLSRRSQGLVERQLRLMEQLERHEENPEQLANLFKLDHLATRMRRNNENLMVLSGLDLSRRFTKPLPLGDVLRAAVSEIEHYQRAVVRSAPTATVVGYAAGDLVRLIAELLDNATAFSRPDTQVTVDSHRDTNGDIVVQVVDQGIGMGDTELAEANKRVSAGAAVEVPVSRQMGLFVVGRLASRHSFRVRFEQGGGGADGLTASVTVPAELVVRGSGDRERPLSTPGEVALNGMPPAPRLGPDDTTRIERIDEVVWPSDSVEDEPWDPPERNAPVVPDTPPNVVKAIDPSPTPLPTRRVPRKPDMPPALSGPPVPRPGPNSGPTPPEVLSTGGMELPRRTFTPPPTVQPPVPADGATGWFAANTPVADESKPPRQDEESVLRPEVSLEPTSYAWFEHMSGGPAIESSDQVNPSGATAPEPAPPATPEPVWPAEQPAAPPAPQPRPQGVQNGAGLPKRVPKAGLFPATGAPAAGPAAGAAHRDPNRTRGFLASYQSGIRQDHTGAAASSENERGQESP
ncbi:nitrate- and nitrite sensing domain-containing protein [Kutzneria sp. CA-103260]|uniref:nitrate- and nitrite sensing domain-containing protein n=1 Tax=Kutzneria sp. CA-103260 TaxID=2802641 RepID=UPI001BA99DDB|nr:nitrate- and nitrite sensing domain-containing protein [Kutzneria sp. CA-103260]QUQ66441.1 Nitrate and nitrite sensing [Kutzneria sp. CA-103260]